MPWHQGPIIIVTPNGMKPAWMSLDNPRLYIINQDDLFKFSSSSASASSGEHKRNEFQREEEERRRKEEEEGEEMEYSHCLPTFNTNAIEPLLFRAVELAKDMVREYHVV